MKESYVVWECCAVDRSLMSGAYWWKTWIILSRFFFLFMSQKLAERVHKGKKVRGFKRQTHMVNDGSTSIARKHTRSWRSVLCHQLAQGCASSCIMTQFIFLSNGLPVAWLYPLFFFFFLRTSLPTPVFTQSTPSVLGIVAEGTKSNFNSSLFACTSKRFSFSFCDLLNVGGVNSNKRVLHLLSCCRRSWTTFHERQSDFAPLNFYLLSSGHAQHATNFYWFLLGKSWCWSVNNMQQSRWRGVLEMKRKRKKKNNEVVVWGWYSETWFASI